MTFTLFDSLSSAQRRANDGGPLVARFPDDDDLWITSLENVAQNEPTAVYAWTHRTAFVLIDPWAGATGRAWAAAPRAALPGSEGAENDKPRDPASVGSIWRGRTGRDDQWWHVLVDVNQETGTGTFVAITRDHADGRVWCGVSGGGPAAYPPGRPGAALPGTDADLTVGVPTLAEMPAEVVPIDAAAGRLLVDVMRARMRAGRVRDAVGVCVVIDETMAGVRQHWAAAVLAVGAELASGDDPGSMRAKIADKLLGWS